MSTPANLTPLSVVTYPDPVPGRYIVTHKEGIIRRDYPYADVAYYEQVLNGFCATLSQEELDNLRTSPDVEAIYEDGYAEIASIKDNVPLSVEEIDALRARLDPDATLTEARQHETYTPLSFEELKEFNPVAGEPEASQGKVTQNNATWGLQRIIQAGSLADQNDRDLTFTFSWNIRAGRGVDVYVLDTGIDIRHPQFGQRAQWGATFGGFPNFDDNGHGTHCAGTIGSSQFGVAKLASLIAVRVLDTNGRGSWSNILSGMDWVARSAASTRRPSIASMSLGGPAFLPVDQAVENLTRLGVHVVVSSGNDNVDAGNVSPARVPSAITTGASNISDARAWFSNFGSVVDLFAPGENVISTWHTEQGIQSLSGTSMACPHVAGALALLVSTFGNNGPAAWKARLEAMAVRNALTNIPSNTPNLLLQGRSA